MEKTQRKSLIIAVLCATVLFMGVGFAFMSQSLRINGVAHVEDSTFDPIIAGIVPTKVVGGAENEASKTGVEADNITATFGVNLKAPGDAITYEVTIKNNGSIPVKITSITPGANTGTEGIEFRYDETVVGTVLEAGQTTKTAVDVNYLSTATVLAQPGTYEYSIKVLCSQYVK